MIAWFEQDGKVHPIKFRIREDKGNQTIVIEKIRCVKTEKFAGNHMYVFECESTFNGMVKIYEIKYETATCKWMLFKI